MPQGTLMYISQKLSYKLRTDLNMHSPQKLESTFAEILVPNKQNLIVGTIYKHSPMKPHEFKNIFLELVSKLKHQNTNLAGNLIFNLPN